MDFPQISAKVLRYSNTIATTVWKGFKTMASESKSPRLIRKIGTHNGVFHCDEALACYMLKQLPEYEEAEIIRTRDSEVLASCDIVVDVGGVYNPKTSRFDHHQRGFEHTLSTVRPDVTQNKQIKLSSAGLIYAHLGLDVIKEILKKRNIQLPDNLHNIYLHIYDTFIEEIDAIDNGVPMYSEGKPKYRINSHLSARVQHLNPKWNQSDAESPDNLFESALQLVGGEFQQNIIEAVTVWWPAREIVKNAIDKRANFHESGEVILLEEICPWKDHLLELERELDIANQIKFVVFHDKDSSWRVQAIPIQPDSFICRVFLHKDWRGIRDEQLSEISGIEKCVFCHATGFIGGNHTKAGALKMALKSLEGAAVEH